MKTFLLLLLPFYLIADNVSLLNLQTTKLNQDFIEPQMVLIKAGSFYFGYDKGELDERPEQNIEIKKDFYIAKYEVTFDEYDKYCEDRGILKPKDNGWGRGNRPVIYVSYEDAKDYARWLSQKSGKRYRLPTEMEWEYALKGETRGKYHFGDNIKKLKQYAWYDKNSFLLGISSRYFGPQIVGQKEPNHNGIYDMHGNVWEWVDSDYTLDHGSKLILDKNFKVLKGGCWASKAWYLRSSKREAEYKDYTSASDGFRLVRDID